MLASAPLHLAAVAAAAQALPSHAIRGLPAVSTVAAVCALPSCLGYWKAEYGVSYAYGLAMLTVGALTLPAASTPLGVAHATAVAVYGLRLTLFLLYRELCVPTFRNRRERTEANKALNIATYRTLLVATCSILYFCMTAPLRLTATGPPTTVGAVAVGVMYLGFGLAATGDLVKTICKARDGADALVTAGPYRRLRHPNYTGEMIGWTASAVAAFAAVAASGEWRNSLEWLVVSALGMLGINFVLAQAATSLEKRQRKKYAGPEYDAWVKGSWAGVTLPSKPAAADA